jgi:hypothetical protein
MARTKQLAKKTSTPSQKSAKKGVSKKSVTKNEPAKLDAAGRAERVKKRAKSGVVRSFMCERAESALCILVKEDQAMLRYSTG